MNKYEVAHHQVIDDILKRFNTDYLCENDIIFGGGTLIALLIEEYRESVDVDFLCPDTTSYRAVRTQVTNNSLGNLVKDEFHYVREISSSRDAVRTIIDLDNTKIKIEFVGFPDYLLNANKPDRQFPVPFLDYTSCFSTKLLANADRYNDAPHKDIFDLIAMYIHWGGIPEDSWKEADRNYSDKVIKNGLKISLENIISNKQKYFKHAESVKMKEEWAEKIINHGAEKMYLHYLKT